MAHIRPFLPKSTVRILEKFKALKTTGILETLSGSTRVYVNLQSPL
jgi:hypothetical protein